MEGGLDEPTRPARSRPRSSSSTRSTGPTKCWSRCDLLGKAAAADAQLKSHRLRDHHAWSTARRSRALRLGKNTVYVGRRRADRVDRRSGPTSRGQATRPTWSRRRTSARPPSSRATWARCAPRRAARRPTSSSSVDAPRDITRVTYGGRFYNRGPKAHIDLLHTFDGGKTWTKSYTLTDTTPPWDVIHYEKVEDVPAGTR